MGMDQDIRNFEEWISEERERPVRLPLRCEVCPRCGGRGRHTNPAVDGNGITGEEMADLGDDFRDDYFAGVYDVTCEECRGRNVVDVVDEDACPADLLSEWQQWQQEEYDYRATVAAERRMGA